MCWSHSPPWSAMYLASWSLITLFASLNDACSLGMVCRWSWFVNSELLTEILNYSGFKLPSLVYVEGLRNSMVCDVFFKQVFGYCVGSLVSHGVNIGVLAEIIHDNQYIPIALSWCRKLGNVSKNHLKRMIGLDTQEWSLVLWIRRSDRLTGSTGSAVVGYILVHKRPTAQFGSALWRVRWIPKCPEDGLPWISCKTWGTRDSCMIPWSEVDPELSCRFRYKIPFSTRRGSCHRRRRKRGVYWRTSLTVGVASFLEILGYCLNVSVLLLVVL